MDYTSFCNGVRYLSLAKGTVTAARRSLPEPLVGSPRGVGSRMAEPFAANVQTVTVADLSSDRRARPAVTKCLDHGRHIRRLDRGEERPRRGDLQRVASPGVPVAEAFGHLE